MYYITAQQSPRQHKITLEEFLTLTDITEESITTPSIGNTVTIQREKISSHFLKQINVEALVESLKQFNQEWDSLRSFPRQELYHSFHIPKKTGGFRRIDAPVEELMTALRSLKTLLERDFFALHHTTAFAYVEQRCTKKALERHQKNESKWFAKFDLSNFFGSTTMGFVMTQLSSLFPFCEVVKTEEGYNQLQQAIELGFLNGGLPQGTPLSPMLTNLIMIPFDYTINKWFRQEAKQNFIYTRYADDFLVSSTHTFDVKKVEKKIIEVLNFFNAPFSINQEKTRYGSSSGSNWNLGLMLNRDNNITVGYKKKKQFQAALHNYAMDKKSGVTWELHDVQVLSGLMTYYISVEKLAINNIIDHISKKTELNIRHYIKEDLRNL